MKIDKIGTISYLVHKKAVDEKLENTRIQVCKIVTYQRWFGNVVPVLRLVGGKGEVSLDTHYAYKKIEQAVKAISFKKPKENGDTNKEQGAN